MAFDKYTNPKVAIIGAGPAGITASLYLAKKGIPSCILEKGTHPRSKACADVVTGQAIRILHDLDPELPLDEGLTAKYLPIKGTLLYAPNGKPLEIAYLPLANLEHLPTCITIPRADFDHWLVQKIKASTLIELRENTFVKNCFRDEKTGIWTLTDKDNQPIVQAN